MALDFAQFAAKGDHFLKELAKDLGWPDDRDRAARVLKAVLRALRERLSTEESLQFLAQLPMFLKAAYVDGWSAKENAKELRGESFIGRVRSFGPAAARDLPEDEAHAEQVVRTVFLSLGKYVSKGEWEDMAAQLPKEMKRLMGAGLPAF